MFQFLYRRKYVEQWIDYSHSKKIYAHIHKPSEDIKYPGVILVPGGFSPGTAYDKGVILTAKDITAKEIAVLHYDPQGRGRTVGQDDYWGAEHQKELAFIIDYFSKLPFVDSDNIGILSFSVGVTIASGALARFTKTRVKYLFDWEGPSNRFNTTMNDTYEPVAKFPTSNEDFWKEREAARFIGDIECGYFRYQGDTDHVQGDNKGHALELLNLATKGKASWTKCNDNTVNTYFDETKVSEYSWTPPNINEKKEILKYLLEVQKIDI